MNRKEFLSKLGIGAAFALTATCMGGCAKNNDSLISGNVDFTLDLSDSNNAKLLTNGSYLVKNQIVVAKTISGEYVSRLTILNDEF